MKISKYEYRNPKQYQNTNEKSLKRFDHLDFKNLYLFRFSNLGFRIYKSQGGFTLVELLLYMGIFSMLLVMLFQLFASTLDVQTNSEMNAGVVQDGRFILNRLTYDIHRSDSISAPTPPGSQGTTLQLKIGSATDSYTLTNGNLMFSDSSLGNSDQLNSINTTVSNISFQQLGSITGKNTVEVSFTLTSKTVRQGIGNTETFRTAVGLR